MALLGRGVPIQPHATFPRDFPGPAGAITLSKFRHGQTADTPSQYGYGVPLQALIVIPTSWASTAVLTKYRYGSDPTVPPQPQGYGVPLAPQYTVPRDWSTVVAILGAVRYGSVPILQPPNYGVPLPPTIVIPRDWTPTPILSQVRYGSSNPQLVPPGYGQPLQAYVPQAAVDWSTVAVVFLTTPLYGSIPTQPVPPGYGVPLRPYYTIPRDYVPATAVLLGAFRYGSVPLLQPVGYGVSLRAYLPVAALLVSTPPPPTVPFGTQLGTAEFYGKTVNETWNDAAYRYWSNFVP